MLDHEEAEIQPEPGAFQKWYRGLPVFAKSHILPFTGIVIVWTIPLIYELELFSEKGRLLAYIAITVIAGVFSVAYKNLEAGEKNFYKAASECYRQMAEKARLSLKEQIRLKHYFRHIVREKSDRFAQAILRFQNSGHAGGKIDRGEVFDVITQPETQLSLILEKLGQFFEVGREHIEVEVVLFRPNTEKTVFECAASYPKDAKPREVIHLDRGVCGRAFEEGRMVVVQDIALDLESGHPVYYAFKNSAGRGSIFCCPIQDGARSLTPFILSVYISEPDVFLQNDKDHLDEIVSPFKARILMEERLLVLKQASSPPTQSS